MTKVTIHNLLEFLEYPQMSRLCKIIFVISLVLPALAIPVVVDESHKASQLLFANNATETAKNLRFIGYEHAIFFFNNSTCEQYTSTNWAWVGTKKSVEIDPEMLYPGMIMVHNHPILNWLHPLDCNQFSPVDLKSAYANNCSEIYLSTPFGLHHSVYPFETTEYRSWWLS